MSDESAPPVVDQDTKNAGEFVIRTKMLIKMGIGFDDPRLALAKNQFVWWPQAVFELQTNDQGKPAVEVRVNETDRTIEYDLMLAQVPEATELAKRAAAVAGWTQQLVGEEWLVFIKNRAKKTGKYKVVYRAERQKSPDAESSPPTLVDAPFPDAVTRFRRYRGSPTRLKQDDDLELGPILPDTKR